MTRRLGRGDATRGRARLVLVVVTFLAAGFVAALTPGGILSSALAAVSGTPTATTTETNTPGSTTTPSPPATATIQLLNPSGYEDPAIISNKTDADSSYHLVAWVGNIGSVPNPVVRFVISGGPTLMATRVGESTSVWHAFWNVAEGDGEYTVTATLSNGPDAAPVASDSRDVTANNSRETVEITYPTAAGTLGTFDPDGGGPIARGFVIDATVSAGATGVQVFFGTSPTGTEQNWRRCVVQETVEFSEGRTRRIACTVPSNVTEAHITGVAAVVTGVHDVEIPPQCDFPDPGFPPTCSTVDAGDAHRVFAYDQFAASLTLAPTSSTSDTGKCRVLTATTLDHLGRPIWRVNVDVHAIGPKDDLQFGQVADTTRAWSPANAGAHSALEPTSNCGGAGTPPPQAEHDGPGSDTKHIETQAADQPQGGADTSGVFTFALRSATPGTTNVEAWADVDDSDTLGTEPVGTATITWQLPPSPSSSPTGSQSPSGSPTATPSPTATQSATSAASESAPPQKSARTVTIVPIEDEPVQYRSNIVFRGTVDSDDPGCEAGETVSILRRPADETDFQEIGTAVTRSNGVYRFVARDAKRSADYAAQIDETELCGAAVSNPAEVGVRVLVTIRASDDKVEESEVKKTFVTFFGKVRPCGNHATTKLKLLDRSEEDKFFVRDPPARDLDGTCRAQFKLRVRKTTRYRMFWSKQDDDHEAGSSDTITVKVVKDD